MGDVRDLFPKLEVPPVLREPSHRDVNDRKMQTIFDRFLRWDPTGPPFELTAADVAFLMCSAAQSRHALKQLEQTMADAQSKGALVEWSGVAAEFIAKVLDFDETTVVNAHAEAHQDFGPCGVRLCENCRRDGINTVRECVQCQRCMLIVCLDECAAAHTC